MEINVKKNYKIGRFHVIVFTEKIKKHENKKTRKQETRVEIVDIKEITEIKIEKKSS